MSREQDAQVARIVGYTVIPLAYAFGTTRNGWRLKAPDGQIVSTPQRTEAQAWGCVPAFTEDITTHTALVAYIVAHELQERYIEALLKVLDGTAFDSLLSRLNGRGLYAEDVWRVVTAGARERVVAFVAIAQERGQ